MAPKTPISSQQVRTRRVFYIPGYDPIHPRRYRELYRKESKLQAEISGYDIEINARSGAGAYGWSVRSDIDGIKTQSTIEVLVWSDIVRDSMATGIFQTYVQLIKTAWIYLRSGALFRLATLRKGPLLAALYPVVMLITQLVIAIVIGVVLGRIVGWVFSGVPFGSSIAFWVLALVTPILVLRRFKARDNRYFAYYLMHDFAHSAKENGAYSDDLRDRLSEFRSVIEDALNSDVDEVLVVGHSSGAHLGVSILAELLDHTEVQSEGPSLGFLTLGHVVPMISFLPDANELRRDLQVLSACPSLTWIDVTAPGDGCAFALCDPVAVTGVAPKNQLWPLIMSAAFTQTLSPERWKELRWRFFRLHFQYLCAFDRPKDYDYFQITGGPQTLANRFKGRPQSRSRITRAVSGHRSLP